MADLAPAFVAQVGETVGKLPELDYFQILKVAQEATPVQIRAAYHRESRLYHPDQFCRLEEKEFRDLINLVYKRINEAYVVLRDDRARAQYLADIRGPDRAAKLRFTESSEAEARSAAKKMVEEQVGATPQGRKLYEEALKEIEGQRFEAAERKLKMALAYEPQNAAYKAKLAEAQKNIKMDFRIK